MLKRLRERRLAWRRIAQFEPFPVEGVAENNEEESGRQQILRGCHEGMRVVLQREPESSRGVKAVAVCTCDERRMGYLPTDVASWVAPMLESGRTTFDAEIWTLRPSLGDRGESQIDCTIVMTQFGLVAVERSWLTSLISAVGRLPRRVAKRATGRATGLVQSRAQSR